MNPSLITNLASSFYDSCVLFAAADANIFSTLHELGEADSETVAHKLRLDPHATRLLLDACVAIKLIQKNDSGTYANSPESELFLVPGSPADLTNAIRYNRDVYQAWGKLGTFIETGAPVESPALHLGDDEERTRTFVLSMHGRAKGIGQSVIPLLDLSECKTLLDVGGGPGTYSCLIADKWPEISCTVLDLPPIVAVAEELITSAGASDRVKTMAGDYRTTPFPEGLDAVLFFGMLHQESPESIQALLKKAYQALNPGGVVYVLDMMTDSTRTQPSFSALFALNMALTTQDGWGLFGQRPSDMDEGGWLHLFLLPITSSAHAPLVNPRYCIKIVFIACV